MEVKEHDLVIVNSKCGTVVYVYNDERYEIEYVNDRESHFETVSKEQIVMVLDKD